jgi:hypothetical protein
LQLKGYAWFYKSLIVGNVDFIWGANHVALFEDSEVRSVGDSSTAASGWREYASRGAGGDMTQRKNGYALSAEEATTAYSTRAQIFSAYANSTGWIPEPYMP